MSVCVIKPKTNEAAALAKLSQGIVDKIEVDLAKREWKVWARFPCKVEAATLEQWRQQLLASIPGLTAVHFAIDEDYVFPPVDVYLTQRWPEMVAQIQAEKPLLAGWLQGGKCLQAADGKVTIEVESDLGLAILQQEKGDAYLQEFLYQVTGERVTVHFVSRGDHAQLLATYLAEQAKASEAIVREAIDRQAKQNGAAGKSETKQVLLGKKFAAVPVPLKEIVEEERQVTVAGEVMNLDVRTLKSGRKLIVFDLTDWTDSITVKVFEEEKAQTNLGEQLSKGLYLLVRGAVQVDRFAQELMLFATDIMLGQRVEKTDEAAERRVELHAHTKMSAMDSVVDVKSLVKCAAKWGHEAIAITDHGVVQAFPEAYEVAAKEGIKLIYGMEAYLVNDGMTIVQNPTSQAIAETTFVVFDFETTGFNPQTEKITEIGAVKVRNGEILERFGTLVNPERPIPAKITEITGITDAMVAAAPTIEEILPQFMAFCGDAVLVAHNAPFDLSFLQANLRQITGTPTTATVVDTLSLARVLLPHLRSHKLAVLVKELGVELQNHHRAVDDAAATAEVFGKLLTLAGAQGVGTLQELNMLGQTVQAERADSYHAVILAKNPVGLKNLYKLVSLSHLDYYYKRPRIPKSVLQQHREGLLLGSACEAGELYQAFLKGADEKTIREIAQFYDYLEIQPLGNNEFMVREGRVTPETLIEINRKIYRLGKKLHKPVVATCDVHFLQPEDAIYRQILLHGQGFEDAASQAPLYLRTTTEMLAEFAYLGEAAAQEVVVTNTRQIAAAVESFKPIPDELYAPKIEGAEEQIREMSYARAHALYGDPLPPLVAARLQKELDAIIGNGFAVIYLIAHKLVKKSNDDGYLVGSRGSVGSSFVATMCGITEVNPLPPHYLCPHCKHSEFLEDGRVGSGFDLPDKECPQCGTRYQKNGQDIPFETFLGFKGDKVPDIDLNFSGDYQPVVHKYTEELFGEGYVFRAGTIATLAEKTAYGFVKGYLEETKQVVRNAEMNRLVQGCSGVRRTTGQHPGGVMVLPKDCDIHDFTPVQYPANDKSSGVITTHFDYHAISSRLLKLDILGHDDPTVIRMLQDLTGVDIYAIPLDDPATMQLFSSTAPLGVTPEQIDSVTGTLGIPEFGTRFVRQMLEQTKPTTFAELVRISGLSHGTDVWLNNAVDLIAEGKATLAEVISTRDDIMVYLIYQGLEPGVAFKIMERVRKGKGLGPEEEAVMREHGVPEWYIESCQKIKYMFPKAHAVAYVMMAFRIAYFKVHYPEAFYATYFTVRADEFDADLVMRGPAQVQRQIEELTAKGNEATAKEKNMLTILELVREAHARGIKFCKVDLYASDPKRFLITPDGLLCPLGALQGVGTVAAQNIADARADGPFISIEDLQRRAKVSKTVVEVLQNHGCLQGLPETDQLALF